MDYGMWLIYLGVISTIIFIPGPSALLCMSHGLKFGKARSMATVIGGAIAALILMGVSIAGLGAVLLASETAFQIVKLLGASYLIYLGISAWRKSHSHLDESSDNDNGNGDDLLLTSTPELSTMRRDVSFFTLFRKGFMVGLSNPKDILFFSALLPSFLNSDLTLLTQYIVLGGTWFVVDVSAMFIYASIGSKVSPWLNNKNNMRRFERTVGSFFIFTGGALAASSIK